MFHPHANPASDSLRKAAPAANDRRRTRSRAAGGLLRGLAFVLAILVMACSGCGRDAAHDAVNSDANGYVCAACGVRFHTPSDVFAEHCPACSDTDLLPVVGYVCKQDGHVTITIKGNTAMRCEKCGVVVTSIKLPRARELEAWGATGRARNEVLGKQPGKQR